ncbi:MAG: peptidoglycan D,D-transpeptidase FtsI family protein [Amphiplicatus sp.]
MRAFWRRGKRQARCYLIAETQGAAPAPKADPAATSRRRRCAARARRRIVLCAAAFGTAYAVLALRLAFVSFGAPAGPQRLAAPSPPDAPRAEILDRNGVILATNLPVTALEIAGREVWDPAETAAALARAFPDIDRASLAKKLREGRYVEVKSELTPAEQEAAFALGLPGVRFSSRTRRFYPQGPLAAHVVGHMEPGKGGVMGLEGALDKRAGDGPLIAALDMRVQQALEDELDGAIRDTSAKAGWGAVMDARTGEVIALASLPDFDPNDPGAAPADWRRNRATYDRYELGSAFKTVTAAAALEAGTANESSVYDARGAYRVADRTISDFHGENRMLSFSEVIQYSSNIGAARMAADLGSERQRAALKALGQFEPLPIELAENRAPQLPARWGPVETATISFGHGISVTPLHLLAAFTAVVNGGQYRAPTFVKTGARDGAQVFSARTSASMRRVLRRVITDGTAAYAEAEGYFPIGKTSTAEKPARGGYDRSARLASFVGAFPGYEPRYTVLISLDEPHPTKQSRGYATAGWNAAPAFSRFVSRVAPSLGVMPVSEATALAGFYNGFQSASAAPAGGGE